MYICVFECDGLQVKMDSPLEKLILSTDNTLMSNVNYYTTILEML